MNDKARLCFLENVSNEWKFWYLQIASFLGEHNLKYANYEISSIEISYHFLK